MEDVRKHYLQNHRTGDDVLAAAEAYDYAARTPDVRIEVVGGLVLTVCGTVAPEHVAAFAEDVNRSLAEMEQERRAA